MKITPEICISRATDAGLWFSQENRNEERMKFDCFCRYARLNDDEDANRLVST